MKNTPIMFNADEETTKALKLVTKVLGRGNQSEAIRRAIIQTAENIKVQRATTAAATPCTETQPA
jgi:hypothetical protein